MVAAKPSLLGVVPPRAATDNVTAAATLLAMILMPVAEVAWGVTHAAPPPPVVVEGLGGGGELPISPGRELHDPTLPSGLKSWEGSVARIELGCQVASHANVVVEIPSDNEADTMAEPPVSPWELAVVW